tara:strand:- start:1882 stop:2319 length:438 start_codon:yes stop_codon:yes gene_type:complete
MKKGFNTVRKRYQPKPETTNKYKKAFHILSRKMPRVLSLKKPRPISIGFREELFKMELEISKKTIRNALMFYCNSHQYLQCVKEGAERINVNGKGSGVCVTEEEAQAAKEKCSAVFASIKESNKKKKSKDQEKIVAVKTKRSKLA